MSISLFTAFVTGSVNVPAIDPRLKAHVDVPEAEHPSDGPAAHAIDSLDSEAPAPEAGQ